MGSGRFGLRWISADAGLIRGREAVRGGMVVFECLGGITCPLSSVCRRAQTAMCMSAKIVRFKSPLTLPLPQLTYASKRTQAQRNSHPLP